MIQEKKLTDFNFMDVGSYGMHAHCCAFLCRVFPISIMTSHVMKPVIHFLYATLWHRSAIIYTVEGKGYYINVTIQTYKCEFKYKILLLYEKY